MGFLAALLPDAALAGADSAAADAGIAGATTAASASSSLLPYIAGGAIGTSLLSGVAGATGAEEQASANAAAANFQAQISQNNAAIATQQGQITAASGEEAAYNQGMKTRAAVGALEAAQGASNIDVNTGSALQVRQSEDTTGQLDAMTVLSNAARQVYGYNTEAASDTAQGQLYQSGAQQDKIAGNIGAASSVLSAAASAGSEYATWQLAAGHGPQEDLFG